MRSLSFAVLVAACLVQGPGPAQPPAPKGKRALLIGINTYQHPNKWSSLVGSVNDVQAIKSVLIGRYEFAPQNVMTLLNEQATRQAILGAIQQHLIAKAGKDDIVVIHYSGHGSRMKDVNGDEPDGLDETIVPYDSRDPAGKVFDISDDELNALMGELGKKTRNITVILDSCFSGTGLRGDPSADMPTYPQYISANARFIPDDTRKPPPPEPFVGTGARGVSGFAPAQFRYVLLSAAREKQVAFEYAAAGREYGALSYFLASALRSAPARATYRDVMDVVTTKVNSQFPNQNPQLEGGASDQFVFGDAEALAQSYFPARSDEPGIVAIDGGEVHGLTRDSLFDIYPPGTKVFAPPAKRLAQARLTRVTPFASEGVLGAKVKAPDGARAVERVHRFGSLAVRIYLDNPSAPEMAALRAALADLKHVAIADRAASAGMRVRVERGRYLTLAPDGYSLSPPVPVASVERVKSQIARWAKWFNVLNLSGGSGGPVVKFEVVPKKPAAGPAIRGVAATLNEGDKLDLAVENASGRDVYISIVDLSTDGSIDIVYPAAKGASELLRAGGKMVRTMETFVPKNRTYVKDTLKVFASEKAVDLQPLRQDSIRGPSDLPADPDPLSALLSESAGETRGVRETDLGSWFVTQKTILVRRVK